MPAPRSRGDDARQTRSTPIRAWSRRENTRTRRRSAIAGTGSPARRTAAMSSPSRCARSPVTCRCPTPSSCRRRSRGRARPARPRSPPRSCASAARVATGEARLIQSGKEIVRAVATFADARPGERSGPHALTAARAAPARAVPRPDGRLGVAPRRQRHGAIRVPLPRPPQLGGRPAEPRARSRFLAAVPRRRKGSATIELTVHLRAKPAAGWLACRTYTRHLIGDHHEEDFEIWDSTGALVAQSRQFALLL